MPLYWPCHVGGTRTNALLDRPGRRGRLRREDTFGGSVGNNSHKPYDMPDLFKYITSWIIFDRFSKTRCLLAPCFHSSRFRDQKPRFYLIHFLNDIRDTETQLQTVPKNNFCIFQIHSRRGVLLATQYMGSYKYVKIRVTGMRQATHLFVHRFIHR